MLLEDASYLNDPTSCLCRCHPTQIDPWKPECPAKCAACPFSWKATAGSLVVPIFFKEPMNINRIFIKQVRNSGVVKVQYIKWTGAPSNGNYAPDLGRVIYNVSKVRWRRAMACTGLWKARG